MRWVLSPDGLEPDAGRLAEVPATLMSDTLVELMEPYICWPPASDELEDLEQWLQLGASVWNVTVEAKDRAGCVRGLARLAAELEVENAIGLVEEIAGRRFSLFPMDRRHIVAVRVVAKEGRVWVDAATAMRVPGVRQGLGMK